MVDINEYTRETTCEYKGELYSVRDNGAVMRHLREGKKVRKLDNIWTFGTKDKTNGYMMINSHRVHIIVAKAFIPGNKDGKMVVDHIDTNRCNNRVGNLRWLTKLENVLLNEATLKRVTYLCDGDIQKFIDNPSCLRDLTNENQDIMWMRTVTAEEAKLAWERISSWAKRPTSTFKIMQKREKIKGFNEWLKIHEVKDKQFPSPQIGHFVELESCRYTNKNVIDKLPPNSYKQQKRVVFHSALNEEILREQNKWKEKEAFANKKSESFTKGALQLHFYEKMKFPLTPEENVAVNLDEYAKRLQEGKIIAYSKDGKEYTIKSMGWSWEWDAIQVEVKQESPNLSFCIHISIEDGKYLHRKGDYKKDFRFCDSPNVLQCGAVSQCHFPLCPKEGNITLKEYANLLHKGALFEKNPYSKGYIIDQEITQSDDGTPVLYVGIRMPESFKQYGEVIIFIEHGKVIHQIGRAFFDEKALERTFCKMRGQKWDDSEEVFDDYC
ncbi:MAG: HNH endonuclease [Bacteroidaceae bacterium]|nr:HNH endonuclease [Bacteroidaceae bacterium]